ncbi:MAG: hypothetical protein JWO39_1487, partial [Gemmatimonadetes bacterium]|nr:hypothetical protein [Gemmatimonadota bacterium]
RLVATMGARGAAFSLAAAALLAGLAAFWLGDARWISEPAAPAIAWVIVLVAIGVPLAWTIVRVRRSATPAKVAHAIERERALRDGSLRGALEVEGQGVFGERGAGALGATLASHPGALAPAMLRGAVITGAGAFVCAMLALVLLGGARRNSPDGWRAMRHPVGAWTGALVPPLSIVDPPREVMRGDSLRLRILAPSRRTIEFHTRATGAPWSARTLEVSGGAASVTLGPLDADMALVATDGRTQTDTVVVHVTDRPFVGDVAIRAIYPAYLDRPAETVPAGETVRVPRGTTLVIRGRASAVLDAVALVSAHDTVRLEPDGHNFAGRLSASNGGRWTWMARGARGPVTDVPAPLDVDVLPDSAPRVEIVDPAHDTIALAGNELPIRAAASDDHGLATVTMRSWREMASGSAQPGVEQPLAAPSAPEWSGAATIDASVRGLQPGDVLHVTIAATDNSPWRQTTVSRELVLRVPSLTEQRELARAMGDSLAARATRAASEQKQLAQKTDEASKSRDRTSTSSDSKSNGRSGSNSESEKSAMSYRAAEQSKALAAQQQKLQDQVKSLQKDAQALGKQLQAAGALDSSLSRQLAEAQQMLAQALTPELQQQLEDVQKSTRQQSPDDARQSMQNLARAQQALKQQLERSAEMLKRAALEGSMQTLRDEAKDLAKQERTTAEKMARADSGAGKDAAPLSERSHQLANDVQQLAQRLQQEKAESGPKALQQGAQHAQQSADAMKQAAPKNGAQSSAQKQQGMNGQKDPGAEQQQQSSDSAQQAQGAEQQQGGAQQRDAAQQKSGAQRRQSQGGQPSAQQTAAAQQGAQQMEQAAQQLSDARQQQIQEWKNGLTKDLDKSIQETLQLARQQQALADKARAGGSPSLKGDQSAVQQGVEKVSEGVQRSARQSSHVSQQSQRALGDAQQRVQEATRQTADASPNGQQETAGAMDEAAQSLNEAATKLMADRQRAAKGSSASGFSEMIEKMRQLAKEQGSLNGQSASLMPGAGGQPSGEGSEQARTLARSQRGLAQRTEEAGAGEAHAAAMAKEMRDIAAQLETGRVDASLLDRQQKLFHRLLDAGLSLQKDEREDTGKRESESATNAASVAPGNTNSTGRAALKYPEPTWNELRGLSAEERQSVMEYFKRINAEP